MIADMETQKLSPFVTKLFSRGRNNISLAFISQSYFKVPETIRLNATNFITKILNKTKLQKIESNNSSNTELKDFMKL